MSTKYPFLNDTTFSPNDARFETSHDNMSVLTQAQLSSALAAVQTICDRIIISPLYYSRYNNQNTWNCTVSLIGENSSQLAPQTMLHTKKKEMVALVWPSIFEIFTNILLVKDGYRESVDSSNVGVMPEFVPGKGITEMLDDLQNERAINKRRIHNGCPALVPLHPVNPNARCPQCSARYKILFLSLLCLLSLSLVGYSAAQPMTSGGMPIPASSLIANQISTFAITGAEGTQTTTLGSFQNGCTYNIISGAYGTSCWANLLTGAYAGPISYDITLRFKTWDSGLTSVSYLEPIFIVARSPLAASYFNVDTYWVGMCHFAPNGQYHWSNFENTVATGGLAQYANVEASSPSPWPFTQIYSIGNLASVSSASSNDPQTVDPRVSPGYKTNGQILVNHAASDNLVVLACPAPYGLNASVYPRHITMLMYGAIIPSAIATPTSDFQEHISNNTDKILSVDMAVLDSSMSIDGGVSTANGLLNDLKMRSDTANGYLNTIVTATSDTSSNTHDISISTATSAGLDSLYAAANSLALAAVVTETTATVAALAVANGLIGDTNTELAESNLFLGNINSTTADQLPQINNWLSILNSTTVNIYTGVQSIYSTLQSINVTLKAVQMDLDVIMANVSNMTINLQSVSTNMFTTVTLMTSVNDILLDVNHTIYAIRGDTDEIAAMLNTLNGSTSNCSSTAILSSSHCDTYFSNVSGIEPARRSGPDIAYQVSHSSECIPNNNQTTTQVCTMQLRSDLFYIRPNRLDLVQDQHSISRKRRNKNMHAYIGNMPNPVDHTPKIRQIRKSSKDRQISEGIPHTVEDLDHYVMTKVYALPTFNKYAVLCVLDPDVELIYKPENEIEWPDVSDKEIKAAASVTHVTPRPNNKALPRDEEKRNESRAKVRAEDPVKVQCNDVNRRLSQKWKDATHFAEWALTIVDTYGRDFVREQYHRNKSNWEQSANQAAHIFINGLINKTDRYDMFKMYEELFFNKIHLSRAYDDWILSKFGPRPNALIPCDDPQARPLVSEIHFTSHKQMNKAVHSVNGNIYFVVMPMATGKSTICKRLPGCLDIDELRDSQIELTLKPLREAMQWDDHNKLWFKHTEDKLSEIDPNLYYAVFLHSVEHATYLGGNKLNTLVCKLPLDTTLENLRSRQVFNVHEDEVIVKERELCTLNWSSVEGTIYQTHEDLFAGVSHYIQTGTHLWRPYAKFAHGSVSLIALKTVIWLILNCLLYIDLAIAKEMDDVTSSPTVPNLISHSASSEPIEPVASIANVVGVVGPQGVNSADNGGQDHFRGQYVSGANALVGPNQLDSPEIQLYPRDIRNGAGAVLINSTIATSWFSLGTFNHSGRGSRPSSDILFLEETYKQAKSNFNTITQDGYRAVDKLTLYQIVKSGALAGDSMLQVFLKAHLYILNSSWLVPVQMLPLGGQAGKLDSFTVYSNSNIVSAAGYNNAALGLFGENCGGLRSYFPWGLDFPAVAGGVPGSGKISFHQDIGSVPVNERANVLAIRASDIMAVEAGNPSLNMAIIAAFFAPYPYSLFGLNVNTKDTAGANEQGQTYIPFSSLVRIDGQPVIRILLPINDNSKPPTDQASANANLLVNPFTGPFPSGQFPAPNTQLNVSFTGALQEYNLAEYLYTWFAGGPASPVESTALQRLAIQLANSTGRYADYWAAFEIACCLSNRYPRMSLATAGVAKQYTANSASSLDTMSYLGLGATYAPGAFPQLDPGVYDYIIPGTSLSWFTNVHLGNIEVAPIGDAKRGEQCNIVGIPQLVQYSKYITRPYAVAAQTFFHHVGLPVTVWNSLYTQTNFTALRDMWRNLWINPAVRSVTSRNLVAPLGEHLAVLMAAITLWKPARDGFNRSLFHYTNTPVTGFLGVWSDSGTIDTIIPSFLSDIWYYLSVKVIGMSMQSFPVPLKRPRGIPTDNERIAAWAGGAKSIPIAAERFPLNIGTAEFPLVSDTERYNARLSFHATVGGGASLYTTDGTLAAGYPTPGQMVVQRYITPDYTCPNLVFSQLVTANTFWIPIIDINGRNLIMAIANPAAANLMSQVMAGLAFASLPVWLYPGKDIQPNLIIGGTKNTPGKFLMSEMSAETAKNSSPPSSQAEPKEAKSDE